VSSEAATLRVCIVLISTGSPFSSQPYTNELAPTPVAEHENVTGCPESASFVDDVIVATGS